MTDRQTRIEDDGSIGEASPIVEPEPVRARQDAAETLFGLNAFSQIKGQMSIDQMRPFLPWLKK